jgi:diguanylate cyclase (GGDEF)-like protein
MASDPRGTGAAFRAGAWVWYAALGGAAAAGYFLLGRLGVPPLVPVVWYACISLSGAVALFAGTRVHRPTRRLPWYLLAGGQALYACADLVFYLARSVYGVDQYPYYDDLLYLLSYPLLAAGLIAFVRARTPAWNVSAQIDSLIVTIVAALLLWVYLVSPSVLSSDDSLAARMVSIAYPSMDLLLIAVAIRLVMGAGTRSTSFLLLIAAIAIMFAADVGYGYLELTSSYVPGGVLEGLWLIVVLGLGTAALHPSMAGMTEPAEVAGPQLSLGRFVLLTGVSLAAPVLLLVQHLRGAEPHVVAFAVACILLFSLTLARVGTLAQAQRRMADTDVLTNLYNRRYFNRILATLDGPDADRRPPMSVLILDIDHFKKINDTYGHDGGDRVLAALGSHLRSLVRPGDLAARYGGEEFAILAPGLPAQDLAAFADRIRESVAGTPMEVGPDTTITVTLSIGGAYRADSTTPATTLLTIADQRLYHAKNQGRNRAVTSGDTLVGPGANREPVPA